jgi:hypothetical protein
VRRDRRGSYTPEVLLRTHALNEEEEKEEKEEEC